MLSLQHFFSHLLTLFKYPTLSQTHAHTHTSLHSLTHAHTHISHTLSHSHIPYVSLSLSQLCSYAHTHAHSRTLALSIALSHTHADGQTHTQTGKKSGNASLILAAFLKPQSKFCFKQRKISTKVKKTTFKFFSLVEYFLVG